MVLLMKPDGLPAFEQLCRREKATPSVVGTVTGDGWCTVVTQEGSPPVVDIPLGPTLGKLPPKFALLLGLDCISAGSRISFKDSFSVVLTTVRVSTNQAFVIWHPCNRRIRMRIGTIL